jgi:alpha-galactosidase
MEKLALFICFAIPVFGGLRVAGMSPEPPNEPAIIRISGNRIEFVYNGQSIFKGEITSGMNDVETRQLKNVTGDAVTQVIKFVSRSGEPISIRGAVVASGESFPCAIDRPEDEKADIIRNSVGLSNSLLNRAIYDRRSDWVLSVDLFPAVKIIPQGEQNIFQLTVSGNPISLRFQPRYYQYHRGLTYYEPWTYTVWDRSIAGWCSWYAYMDDISEEKIKRTADVISEKLRPYGYNYFQIDDGYERQPSGFPATWLQPNDKFPSGLANLADYIHGKGLIPGIWSNVSFQDHDSAYAHKDLFVQDEHGVPALGEWIGYPLDGSNSAAIDRIIRPVFHGFKNMGWRYFKVDALRHLRYEGYNSFADYFAKKHINRVTAYRNVMKAIREETGKDNPILGCWGIRPELIGLIDACRIGNDGYSRAGLAQYNSFNNVVWRNDPDHIQLTTKDAYRDCMLTSMTGSLLMLTDKPGVYDTGNIEPAIRSAPVLFTWPGQLYDVDPSRSNNIDRANTELSGSGPRVFDAGSSTPYDLFLLEINEPYENWMLLGRVGERRKHISFAELGLEPSRVYLVFEYWSKTFEGAFRGGFTPGPIDTVYNCQLFCIREAQDHPQLMATNRHLSCGALELTGVAWDNDTLSGRSSVMVDEPYILYLYEPKGFTYSSFTCEGGTFLGTEVTGSIRQIKLTPAATGAVIWKVVYKKGEARSGALPFPEEVKMSPGVE